MFHFFLFWNIRNCSNFVKRLGSCTGTKLVINKFVSLLGFMFYYLTSPHHVLLQCCLFMPLIKSLSSLLQLLFYGVFLEFRGWRGRGVAKKRKVFEKQLKMLGKWHMHCRTVSRGLLTIRRVFTCAFFSFSFFFFRFQSVLVFVARPLGPTFWPPLILW